MILVHFLINKLDIEHIIALGGKKSNEKLGKKGNQCKNAANSVTGHVCVNSNESIEKCMGGGNGKILPPPYCSICMPGVMVMRTATFFPIETAKSRFSRIE